MINKRLLEYKASALCMATPTIRQYNFGARRGLQPRP